MTRSRCRMSRLAPIMSSLVILGLVAIGGYFRHGADTIRTEGIGASNAAPGGKAAGRSVARMVSRPVHLTIASIGVSTALQALTLRPGGSLQAPTRWDVAGWYSGGVVPGQVGPAVITGHVDSRRGPAVFYRLRALRPGAKISVTARNGRVLTFIVDRAETFPKSHFPTQAVYGPTRTPQLRLISCTGEFDWAAHNYLSNLVVTAHLRS
jgi:hypothetical protein